MIAYRADSRGIDAKIKMIQTYLNSRITWDNAIFYGRLDVRDKEGEEELVILAGTERKSVFFDDTYNAVTAFYINERDYMTANVDVIVTLNLKKLYNTDFSEDTRAIDYFKRCLFESALTTSIGEIKYGNKEVFSGFRSKTHRDTFPYLTFSINCNIRFNSTDTKEYNKESLLLTESNAFIVIE